MGFWDFVQDRASVLWFLSYQHMSVVVQCLILATIIGLLLAVLLYRSPMGAAAGNTFSAVGLTVPSFALLGILIAVITTTNQGVIVSVISLTFYGCLPILRNAIVGLRGVDPTLVESARGMGMSRLTILLRLEVPLAWPIIMTGVRVAGQMMMGIAAITAYVLGPGLGGYIFSGISRMGGANAANSVVAATVGILILAVILDVVLNIVTRLTTSRGIRV
ncbi:MAG: ABC transporter permease [Nocardioidaceae bacterium]